MEAVIFVGLGEIDFLPGDVFWAVLNSREFMFNH